MHFILKDHDTLPVIVVDIMTGELILDLTSQSDLFASVVDNFGHSSLNNNLRTNWGSCI